MSLRALIIALCGFTLQGCSPFPKDMWVEPALTPIGAGVGAPSVPIPMQPQPPPPARRGNSLWQDASADLFRDARAIRSGDIVTVLISMKDKAEFDNSSKRSRDADNTLGVDLAYDLAFGSITGTGEGNLSSNVNSKTEMKGEGGITRSESINLKLAAVVTDVMPNGNLLISGSQEVRVNYEVRVLSVAGIVRPRDIATDNTIAYDKVAEARISYGGRGRIMEVQQPGWGHQIVDAIAPF